MRQQTTTNQRFMRGKPTPKQMKYLAFLSRDKGYRSAGAAARAHGYTWSELTFDEASALIDALKNGEAKNQPDPQSRPLTFKMVDHDREKASATLQRTIDRHNQRQEDNRQAYEREQERQGTTGPISLMALAERLSGQKPTEPAEIDKPAENQPPERPQVERSQPETAPSMDPEPLTIHTLRTRDGGHGFIKAEELKAVISENRLYPVLVRFDCGRFVAPAQDVEHFIELIEASGKHYCRDVSLNHNSAPAL